MADLNSNKTPLALGIPRDDSTGTADARAEADEEQVLEAIARHEAQPETESDDTPALPSMRMIAMIGAALVAMLSILLVFRAIGEIGERQVQTELVQSRIAVSVADALEDMLDGQRPENSLIRRTMLDKSVGPKTAIYDISSDQRSYVSTGATEFYSLHPDDLAPFDLSGPGVAILDKGQIANGSVGKTMITWRPMSNGRTVVVLSPARDILARTPVWISHMLMFVVFMLISGSLFLLLRRQNHAVSRASGALEEATEQLDLLASADTGAWHSETKAGLVTLPAILLKRLDLGTRDRKMSMREISGLIHPKDARAVISLFSGKGGQPGPMQFRMRTGARDWLWVMAHTAAKPSLEASKELSATARGLVTVLGESPIDNGRAAKLQARLTDAIESIPEAFLLWDDQGRLVTWNRKFCNIFRIQPTRLRPGQSVAMVASLADEGAELIAEFFAPPLDAREQSHEVRLPANRWGHVSRRKTQEGGWVCVVTNITDMKRRARAQKRKERELELTVETLEQSRSELREALHNYQIEKKRAEDANLSKSEFLANMSHELRTPLNAINGFSEVMQSELYGPLGHAKYNEYVDDILGSGRHLLTLIDDILDMSKIEAGRMDLETGPIDLERILAEGLRFVEPETREKDILLTSSIPSLPSAWADNRATKQVFINLLSNAVKFTEPEGSVTVTAQADLDSISVLIADTGIGIAADRMGKLGEPFELVEDHLAKSRNGSGLGLALSKSLMELQDGLLVIASEKGRGTVAALVLPRREGVTVKVPAILKEHGHVLTRLPAPAKPARLRSANENAAE